MWRPTVLCIIGLFSTTLTDDKTSCHREAPDKCDFELQLQPCNWSFLTSHTWNFDSQWGPGSAVWGTDGSLGANITSMLACSTERDTHCLQIRYLFEEFNISLDVYMYRKEAMHDKVWGSRKSTVTVWHLAEIAITSASQFKVMIEVKGQGKMYIDYIRYVKSPCTASSSVSAVVIGVIAVFVTGVGVAIFILYRRKRLHPWKTCFRNKSDKETTGSDTSQNTTPTFGSGDTDSSNLAKRITVGSINSNHNVNTVPESQSSDNYYSAIQDTDAAGGSAVSHYSTIQETESADGKKLPNPSKVAEDDPYEIKAEGKTFHSESASTRYTNPNANVEVQKGWNGNHLPPSSHIGNGQSPADYSLTRATEDGATGVYHYLEEDLQNQRELEASALYHHTKDPDMNREGHADATGVYHILEENPAISRDSQLVDVYSVHQDGKMGRQHIPAVKVSKGQTGNYNMLEFSGNNSGQKIHAYASGGVYNHLNAGSDDPYNEVDRDKRAEVIDGEYSHIK